MDNQVIGGGLLLIRQLWDAGLAHHKIEPANLTVRDGKVLLVVVLTIAFRRWRHLLVFMGSLLFLELVGTWIYFGLSRPRPYGVPIITGWGGYSGVAAPVSVLAFFLMGIVYCLAVPGRARSWTKGMPSCRRPKIWASPLPVAAPATR